MDDMRDAVFGNGATDYLQIGDVSPDETDAGDLVFFHDEPKAVPVISPRQDAYIYVRRG